MNFKRYDGFIGSAPQKKIDTELPRCPFCGENPHWLLDIKQGFSTTGVTCMCEKCNGKVYMENNGFSFGIDLRIVDTGAKNFNNLQLNGSYHIAALKSLTERTVKNEEFFNDTLQPQITTYSEVSHSDANQKKIGVAFGIISFIVVFFVFLWILIPGGLGSPTSSQLEPIRQSSMSVEESFGYYYVTITGSAKNTSNKTMDYVSITFTLYDSAGNVVGTAIDNQSGLGAGETWIYSASGISTTNRPVSWKSTDVTVICY